MSWNESWYMDGYEHPEVYVAKSDFYHNYLGLNLKQGQLVYAVAGGYQDGASNNHLTHIVTWQNGQWNEAEYLTDNNLYGLSHIKKWNCDAYGWCWIDGISASYYTVRHETEVITNYGTSYSSRIVVPAGSFVYFHYDYNKATTPSYGNVNYIQCDRIEEPDGTVRTFSGTNDYIWCVPIMDVEDYKINTI